MCCLAKIALCTLKRKPAAEKSAAEEEENVFDQIGKDFEEDKKASDGNSAAEAYYNAAERGADPIQALNYATIVGAAEMAVDIIAAKELGTLKEAKNASSFWESTMKEISEETFGSGVSSLVSTMVDDIILQNKSEFNSLVKGYQLLGYTKEEAEKEAMKNIREGVVFAMTSSAFSGTVKVGANTAKDFLDYRLYKTSLGKNAPSTFDNYLEVKYNDDEWKLFKEYAYSVKNGEISAFANFDLYKKTEAEINKTLVGTVANGGVKINGTSAHFTNQVIGSVFEKRSGVEIDDIQKALQTKPRVLGETLYYTLDDICMAWVDLSTGKITNVFSLVDRR